MNSGIRFMVEVLGFLVDAISFVWLFCLFASFGVERFAVG